MSLLARLGGHSAPRTHRGKERFPGMTITYALIQMVEKILGLGVLSCYFVHYFSQEPADVIACLPLHNYLIYFYPCNHDATHAQTLLIYIYILYIQIHAYIRNIIYTCVCDIWIDVKLLWHFFFHIAGGHRGPGGVGDQRRHLPETRENVPAGLRWCIAFKSQLVATVVLYIYIYISYQVRLRFYGIQFPMDHSNDPVLF